MLSIKQVVVGPLWVNTYIIWDSNCKEGILVDPGDEGERLINIVRENDINIKHIIITHGHFDHLKDAALVSSEIKAAVLVHKTQVPFIEHVSEQSALFGFSLIKPPHIDGYIEEGDTVNAGSYAFNVYNTPGHSPGSITLYNKPEGIAIVGDLIFFESVGRTDLPGGDYKTLLSSIKDRILVLPDNTKILPGHGEQTTVGHERLHNPFITDIYRDETGK